MNRALSLFEERKSEIEFYYSILQNIDPLDRKSESKINTIDNARFERILKSNFFLMLYNLVEACITTGFIEIYEAIENHSKAYVDLISEFQKIWSDYKVGESVGNSTNQGTYKKLIRDILSDVLIRKPLEFQTADQLKFTKNILHVSGNLDAREIRSLLSNHNIPFADQTDKHRILTVKRKRNALAHGEESFGDSARDFSVSDLKEFKDEVLNFISNVLYTMKEYYDDQGYLVKTP